MSLSPYIITYSGARFIPYKLLVSISLLRLNKGENKENKGKGDSFEL
jgi:hypothetical protein